MVRCLFVILLFAIPAYAEVPGELVVTRLDQIDLDHLVVSKPTVAVPPTFKCNCGCEQGALCTCEDCPAKETPTQLVSIVNGSRRDAPLYPWAQPGGAGSPIAPLMEKPKLTQAEADAALVALNQPVRKAVKGAAKVATAVPKAAVKAAGKAVQGAARAVVRAPAILLPQAPAACVGGNCGVTYRSYGVRRGIFRRR